MRLRRTGRVGSRLGVIGYSRLQSENREQEQTEVRWTFDLSGRI